MAGQFLALSLFIILLSFFIVLTTLADFDSTKVAPVLTSLEMAFGGSHSINEKKPSEKLQQSEQLHRGNTLDQIKGLFNARIQNFTADKNRLGTEMYVRMSQTEFERILKASVHADLTEKSGDRPTGNDFLPTLVSILKTAEDRIPYRMDILLSAMGNPARLQNQAPQKLDIVMQKAAGYARSLEVAGMSPNLVSAGLSARSPDEKGDAFVELIFRRYEPVNLAKGQNLKELQDNESLEDG